MLDENIGELHEGRCLIVNYVLSTGQKGTLPLNKEQIKYFLDCLDKNKTMVLHIGDEIRTLNPQYVAFTYLKGMDEKEIHIKPVEEVAIEITKTDSSEELKKAYYSKELFQIECKCGEEYQREYSSQTQKRSCEKCNEMIFVDRKRGKQLIGGELVWIITNRYFVERDTTYLKN